MKIIITVAIYPPEVGGPSFYAKSLKEALEKAGHRVDVVLFGKLKKVPSGLRHLLYALKVLWAARGSDGVIVLDSFSTAVPVGLVAPFLRAPVLCRVGGDFVWEQYVERTHDPIPLPVFYDHKDRWSKKERVAFRLVRFALHRMRVVFSSSWQASIWLKPYGLQQADICVIENAMPDRVLAAQPRDKTFLFFGRSLVLKNAERFHRAFDVAKREQRELKLEEGIVSRDELHERYKTAYAIVLPSISDVTPNTILEAIQYGKPFLLTKYSGYAERFKDLGVIVDPLSQEDITRGILELADDATYARLAANIAALTEVRTYNEIAQDFIALLETP